MRLEWKNTLGSTLDNGAILETRLTGLQQIDQPRWCTNGDSCPVLLEELDLLCHLEVLCELCES